MYRFQSLMSWLRVLDTWFNISVSLFEKPKTSTEDSKSNREERTKHQLQEDTMHRC